MEKAVLSVRNLTKRYPSFTLDSVSFDLLPGRIVGFIGRNGAGKSTTLKSVMNFLHPDGGEISFFGTPSHGNERELFQHVGFVAGGVNFYANKKIKTISSVTRSFYKHWDENVYRECLRRFNLDEEKTPAQLSAGMQVKYSVALALSHGAQLLIFDEPTSGLDPVSREDMLEWFLALAKEGKTVLFSTHITSDLDACADDILYIRNGKIAAAATVSDFVGAYRLIEYREGELSAEQTAKLIGVRLAKNGCRALVRKEDEGAFAAELLHPADLESVMVHLEKEDD